MTREQQKKPEQPRERPSLPVTRQTTSQNRMNLASTSNSVSTATKKSVNKDGLSSSDAVMDAITPLNKRSL